MTESDRKPENYKWIYQESYIHKDKKGTDKNSWLPHKLATEKSCRGGTLIKHTLSDGANVSYHDLYLDSYAQIYRSMC